jgi:serine/threonine-protein kinase
LTSSSSSSSSAARHAEATDPVASRSRTKLAPLPPVAPAPVPPVAPAPQVVYRAPAGLLVAVGVLAGVALALGVLVFVKNDPPPIIVQAPVSTSPAALPPAPVPALIDPPVAAPIAQSSPPPSPSSSKPRLAAPLSPARASTPTAPGHLEISSTPALALAVDGKPVGDGTASLDLPAGMHTVVGTGSGLSLKKTITVRPGATERITLVVQTGTLSIDAPPGCDVFVDGRLRGKTPMEPLELPQGMHKVLVKQGSIPYTQNVPIQPNLESYLQVQFHSQ